jgi:hypothetical protein
MTTIKQIKVATSHGETSGVCNAEVNGIAYQFSVGDEGTLTITNLAENKSVSLEISKDDGDLIGFEDLDIHNNTLSLLEEANKAWHNDRLYNFNLEEIVKESFDASKGSELNTSLASVTELSGSKDFPGTTTKNGSGTENNGAEAFAYLNNGTAVTARQFMLEDGQKSFGENSLENMSVDGYQDYLELWADKADSADKKNVQKIALDNNVVRGDINSMRETDQGNLLMMHGDASIKSKDGAWKHTNSGGNEGVLRVQSKDDLSETIAYYDLSFQKGDQFRNAEGIDIQTTNNNSTELTFAFDNSDSKDVVHTIEVGGLDFDNNLDGEKESIRLGSDEIDTITGSSSRRSYLAGGDGNDKLIANGATLNQGDVMTGGKGVDNFIIDNGNHGIIWDFQQDDTLKLDGVEYSYSELANDLNKIINTPGSGTKIGIGGEDTNVMQVTGDNGSTAYIVAQDDQSSGGGLF